MTLFDTLEAAHGDIIGSVRYQDFSLPKIKEDDGSTIFNTLVNFRKYSLGGGEESEASIAFEPVEAYDPFDYDIVVGIAECRQEASVVLAYWNSRVPHEQAEAVAVSFRDVLSHILRESQPTISNILEARGS